VRWNAQVPTRGGDTDVALVASGIKDDLVEFRGVPREVIGLRRSGAEALAGGAEHREEHKCARIRTTPKKAAVIARARAVLAVGGTVWAEGETTLRELPPLRSTWARRGEQAIVVISGWLPT
jgi:hypothetical protein